MSLLDDLWDKIGKKKKDPTLKGIIRKATHCRNIFIRDRHVDPITDEEFDEYLKVDNCHKLKWEEEGFDCDDISLLFLTKAKEWFWKQKKKNVSIGWIWAELPEIGKHAFIFYVRKGDFKCVFFKPQIHERFHLHSRPSLMIA